MIELTTFMTTNDNYRKLLDKKLYDTYIHQHLDYPVIDEEKWKLLRFFIEQHKSLTDLQREKYMITTMLVQIALDTHDLVPVKQTAENEKEIIEKQLQVLSGDYYSGLYYQILAEAGEIEFIRILANAIREINERKVRLYYERSLPLEAWLNQKMKINACLLVHVANFLYGTELEAIIQNWLMYRRIANEEAEHGYSLLRTEWESSNGKMASIPLIDERLRQNFERIALKEISSLSEPLSFVQQYIHSQEFDSVKTSRL